MKSIALAAIAHVLLFGGLAASVATADPAVAPALVAASDLTSLPMHIGGRVESTGDGKLSIYTYQWPGTYFETAFTGKDAYFQVGTGDVIMHVTLDGQILAPLVKPAAGLYHIDGLTAGAHSLRIEVATESQAGADHFGGFFAAADTTPRTVPARRRQIEFIGDSHTVGYGNVSTTRDCTADQVWATTDDTQAFGPLTAKHYNADYEINAISGRGIVRNYDGFAADHLPEAYPYILFDRGLKDLANPSWQPQVVVMALGTNDFSTALKPAEQWKTRDDLHADYEKTYVAFIHSLRARYPSAYFVLWGTEMANGEIESEEQKVVDEVKAGGETRITFLPVNNLAFTGCHSHPSTRDDQTISGLLIKTIDQIPDVWKK